MTSSPTIRSPAASRAAMLAASIASSVPVSVKYALPARSTATRVSRTVTSATLHAASAAAIAAGTVFVSMIATASAFGSADQSGGETGAPSIGHTCVSAAGRKTSSSLRSPAARRAAPSDSSTSATPPSKNTRCLPPETAREWSRIAGERLRPASALPMPRAIVAISSTPRAGPRIVIASDEAEAVFERAAALAREVDGRREPLARRRRDRERRVAFAAEREAGVRRVVLEDDRAIADPRLRRHVVDVRRVHRRGVMEAVLDAQRRGDRIGRAHRAEQRDHRHQQLVLHEWMVLADLAHEEAQVVAVAGDADRLRDHAGVLADPVLVDVIAGEDDARGVADLAIVEPQHRLALELLDQAVRDRVVRVHFLLD